MRMRIENETRSDEKNLLLHVMYHKLLNFHKRYCTSQHPKECVTMEDENEHRGTKRYNDDDDDDDPSTLWERLQESQRKKMKLLKDETEQLQKEKDVMNSVGAAAATTSTNEDDIIEINAGGKMIEALRSTLTLVAPDTMFSYMFSGRWEESLKRDRNGRVFIDENSELIEIIVDFLRMKKREDPSKPSPPPTVHDDKKGNFLSLLNCYGLTEFFYPSLQPSSLVLDIANIVVVKSVASSINVIKSENKIQFSHGRNNGYEHVTCQPPLDSSGEGAFWKATIDRIESGGGIFLGIIGNLNPELNSGMDSTSYGVTPLGVYRGGSYARHRGWKGFVRGDCIYFKFKSNKLTMYCVRKEIKFVMDIPRTGNAYIHFNLYRDTKLTLEPLDEEEHKHLL